MDVSSFWQYIGFGGCFLFEILIWRIIENLIFAACGNILVLAVACSNSNSIYRNGKIWFLQLWFGFGGCLKSLQPSRIAFPRDAWKAHGHAGSAFPDMIEKLTAMQDRLSQRWLKSSQPCRIGCTRNASQPCSPRDAWKAQSHAG